MKVPDFCDSIYIKWRKGYNDGLDRTIKVGDWNGVFRMSLKHKTTMMVGLMLVLMIIVSINAIFHQSSKMLNEESEIMMNAQLDRANENVSLLLKSIVLETENLSLDHNVKAYFQGNFTQEESDVYLENLMAQKNDQRPVYMDLFLVNHDGIIVSAAMPEAVGIDVSGRMYFQRAYFDNITNTSDILLSRADQTQIVITLTPTYNQNNQVIGYTGIAIFARYFSDFLEDMAFNDKSRYIIVDSYNKIVSHPDANMISKQFDNFGLTSFYDNENGHSYIRATIDNEEHILMERDLGFNNWRIISFLSSDEIYSKSKELAGTVLKVGIVFVFIALGLSIYLTDMIGKPLVEITEDINRVIEESIDYNETMIHKLPFDFLDRHENQENKGQEPTEISNFKVAMQGFRQVLERGSKNFEIEYEKLKIYLSQLYDELDNVNKRNLDFIATLSHDIRTPLTLIKGYARGLESGTIIDKDMEKKFKKGIVKSTNDLEHLIYDVLDFAYEVGHSHVLKKQTMSQMDVVDQVLFEIKHLYAEYDRTIIIDKKTEGKDRPVDIDMMNITRVLVNLIENSLKYSSDEDMVKITAETRERGLRFEVYDTGLGIRENDLIQVKDIFYRTQDSKSVKGYGLGLYICDQILKAHGSQLEIESDYGVYTRVWFEI